MKLRSILCFASLLFVTACGGTASLESAGNPLALTDSTPSQATPAASVLPGSGEMTTAAALGNERTFTVRLENVAPWTFLKSGIFNTPVDAAAPGPIGPGQAFEFTFTAGRAHRLSFVSMLGASNDWFVGTVPEGLPLYQNGLPMAGDVTSFFRLYDAGTEVDQEPGVGADTGPKQATPTQGAPDPIKMVREVKSPVLLSDGKTFNMPAISSLLRITVVPTGRPNEFRVRFSNCTSGNALMTSAGPVRVGFSPGVYVVHGGANPLYEVGARDRGQGLEEIAEAGRVMTLGAVAEQYSGVATGFSPAAWFVHDGSASLFSSGQPDRGQGLERIAEDGNVAPLADFLQKSPPAGVVSTGVVNTPVGATVAGGLRPGSAYEFTVSAKPGERLNFASMFGASNDWFVDAGEMGIALFDEGGQPISGDRTSALRLWDVGTEQNEELAVGANVGPNQSGPNTGPVDSDRQVRQVFSAMYAVPLSSHLRLTVTVR